VAEELLLLEGIEITYSICIEYIMCLYIYFTGIDKFGVGNWKTVSDHVGSKTARACDDHYWELYMGSYGHCLPAQYFDNDSLRELDIAVPSEIHLPEPVSSSSRLIVRGSNGDGSTGKGSSKKEIDFKEKMSQLPGADLAGYMPLREDFDIEYNNDAELLLADMEFSSEGTSKPIEEHPSEVQLKLDVIRIYNEKLDERDKRKRFVIDRGVVDIRKQTNVCQLLYTLFPVTSPPLSTCYRVIADA
jgi:transcriptional adapter 2-alpha